jgi:prevent-host-death family protein
MEVNIHHAKTNLSRLIVQAEAGEEIIIARAGKPAVKLVPVRTARPKKFKAGALKGLFKVPDNFLDPDPELESMFYDGQILSGMPDEELMKLQPEHPETGAGSK